jgi:hypothetical protein
MYEDEHLEADYEDRHYADDYPDDYDDNYDAELAQDMILERQELEDFEGLNGPFEDFFDGGDW